MVLAFAAANPPKRVPPPIAFDEFFVAGREQLDEEVGVLLELRQDDLPMTRIRLSAQSGRSRTVRPSLFASVGEWAFRTRSSSSGQAVFAAWKACSALR